MVRTLVHRGPDEEGSGQAVWRRAGHAPAGHRRSGGGQQPFGNETDDIQLVANGEIYNFPRAATASSRRGARIRSQSDIEVLVHAYEEWGIEFLTRLRGMFALALWDARTRTLIAARDRAGEKPLYWTLTPRGLLARIRSEGAAGTA